MSITGGGKDLSVHCADPWVLMKVPKGTYRLSSDVAGMGHKDMTIRSPGHVVVSFSSSEGKKTS